jgi:hypothetical protein
MVVLSELLLNLFELLIDLLVSLAGHLLAHVLSVKTIDVVLDLIDLFLKLDDVTIHVLHRVITRVRTGLVLKSVSERVLSGFSASESKKLFPHFLDFFGQFFILFLISFERSLEPINLTVNTVVNLLVVDLFLLDGLVDELNALFNGSKLSLDHLRASTSGTTTAVLLNSGNLGLKLINLQVSQRVLNTFLCGHDSFLAILKILDL